MRNRTVIGILLVVALALVVLWLVRQAPSPAEPVRRSSIEVRTNVPTERLPVEQPATNKPKPWVRPPGLDDAGWKYLSSMREMLLRENQPVEFYARVIDQDGRPVSGVRMDLELNLVNVEKVLAEFPHMRMGSEITNQTFVEYSDAQGWVRFGGVKGHILDVRNVSKERYLWNTPQSLGSLVFEPGKRRALGSLEMGDAFDPAKGYTFRLWKKGETERLVPIRFGVCIPEYAHQVWFSLFNGQISDPAAAWADFSIVETMLYPDDSTRKYDRRISIQGLHGARLMETSEAYPYLAAERGYRPEYAFDVLPSTGYGPQGTWDWSKNFYVMARDGRVFSGLRIDFVGGKLCFSFNGYLNPAGLRNLEPDPEKLITDPEEIRQIDEQTRLR